MGRRVSIWDFGTIFDWISPLFASVQDLVNLNIIPWWNGDLMIDEWACSKGDIQHILDEHDIHNWGYMVPAFSGRMIFCVRPWDRGAAKAILADHGIEVY